MKRHVIRQSWLGNIVLLWFHWLDPLPEYFLRTWSIFRILCVHWGRMFTSVCRCLFIFARTKITYWIHKHNVRHPNYWHIDSYHAFFIYTKQVPPINIMLLATLVSTYGTWTCCLSFSSPEFVIRKVLKVEIDSNDTTSGPVERYI